MVRLVKTKLNKITLAVGDGANDVNMILEANIGNYFKKRNISLSL